MLPIGGGARRKERSFSLSYIVLLGSFKSIRPSVSKTADDIATLMFNWVCHRDLKVEKKIVELDGLLHHIALEVLEGEHFKEMIAEIIMQKMKEETAQVKVGVPIGDLWKAMTDLRHIAPKVLPDIVEKVELLEGDGGQGSILLFHFVLTTWVVLMIRCDYY
ncbi:hypothetical protein LXL04_030982 [Taraxacum kok-saghyz]